MSQERSILTYINNILLAAAVAAMATVTGGNAVASSTTKPGTGGIMPPPADPESVVQKEFDLFLARDTIEGYELFIARHPDHPLAE